MTANEKMELVEEHKDEHGLCRCLEAAGLPKSTWYYRKGRTSMEERDRELKEQILEVVREHPGYGYRRILPEVNARRDRPVNHKRLRRVLRAYDLALPRCLPKHRPSPVREILKKCRGQLDLVNEKSGRLCCMEALSTDITELQYAGGSRKAYLMAFVDIESKLVAGWALRRRGDQYLALDAWEKAKDTVARLRGSTAGLIVHSDQGSVYTSYAWLQRLLRDDEAPVSYSENGCRDNPWIESLWGRLKTEIGSRISEAATLGKLEQIIKEHFKYYNTRRRHSSIEYQAPLDYLRAKNIVRNNGDCTMRPLSLN